MVISIGIRQDFYGSWCSPFLVFGGLYLSWLGRLSQGDMVLLQIEDVLRLGELLLVFFG